MVSRLCQHSTGYLGASFTGKKTQPTVSKYWRKKCCKSKEKPRKSKQHKIQQNNEHKTHAKTQKIP